MVISWLVAFQLSMMRHLARAQSHARCCPGGNCRNSGQFPEGFHEGLLGDVLGYLVVAEGSAAGVAVDGWGVVEVGLG